MSRDEVTAGGPSVKFVCSDKAMKTIAGAFTRQAQVVAEAQRVMAPALAQLTAAIKLAEEVLGCSFDEIIDGIPNMPPEYREIKPTEIVQAGEMGYRGKAALDVAASWHRPTPTSTSPQIFRPRTCRPRRRAARARGTVRRAPNRATRGSPRSSTGDDSDPEHVVHRPAEGLA